VNRLPLVKRVAVVKALTEGNSIRATCRMTGVAKQTVLDLLADLGPVCHAYQSAVMRGLTSRRIECDEIWSFCYAKQRNVPAKRKGEYGLGDVYTWVALDPDSKLVVTWRVGERSADDAERFMRDLAGRVAGRIQITTDGYSPYVTAVFLAFGRNVDFAQLVKQYTGARTNEQRYSPAEMVKSEKHVVFGDPETQRISTSHVERQNLTMRMQMRRMTRLTNGFSKKLIGLENAVALHYLVYNFVRPHGSLRGQTPAMVAGIADHIWTFEEVIGLLSQDRLVAAA
jgi:IS1 family transposase